MAHLSGTGGMDTITNASSKAQIASRNAKECLVCSSVHQCSHQCFPWSPCLHFALFCSHLKKKKKKHCCRLMRYWAPHYSYTLPWIPTVDDNLPIGIRCINLSNSMEQLRDSIESQRLLNKLLKLTIYYGFYRRSLQRKNTWEGIF